MDKAKKDLPPFFTEMQQAAEVLRAFSEKEENYHLYQSRLDAAREYATWQTEVTQAKANLEQALPEKEQERAENERLRALLQKAGIDPE